MTEEVRSNLSTDFCALALFTADHAAVENGKVYVNGGYWQTIFPPSFPARVSFWLVAVVEVSARQFLVDHKVAIELVDADEERLPFRIDGEIRVGTTIHMKPNDPSIVPMVFPLEGLTLERAGDYWFTLSVSGKELARYHIRVIQQVPVPQQLPFDAPEPGND